MKHKTPTSMKFKKLKRRLGLPSYAVAGLLEMLWVTTQVNTPRGDIGKFTNEEIAIELEWEGDPDELIAALVATGWLDESKKHRLIIHNWPDHAPRYIHGIVTKCGGFVSDYSDALQSGTVVATTDPDCTEEQPNLTQPDVKDETQPDETEPNEGGCAKPPAPPPFNLILQDFNLVSGKLCRWTPKRRKAVAARWKDPHWRENWQAALQKAQSAKFLNGDNTRNWSMDMEFFLRPDTVTKILEGNYDQGSSSNGDGKLEPLPTDF